MSIAINKPFIRLVNNEKRDKSSEKYPPKLPVINNIYLSFIIWYSFCLSNCGKVFLKFGNAKNTMKIVLTVIINQ